MKAITTVWRSPISSPFKWGSNKGNK